MDELIISVGKLPPSEFHPSLLKMSKKGIKISRYAQNDTYIFIDFEGKNAWIYPLARLLSDLWKNSDLKCA